jgi:ATP-dependent Clp protease ATP-binding subunit ClpA
MGSGAIQLGSRVAEQNTSRALLILGAGILTYEIVLKLMRKFGDEASTPRSYLPLASSIVTVMVASNMEVSRVNSEFVMLCVVYVAATILTRSSSSMKGGFPDYMTDMIAEARAGKFTSKEGYEDAVEQVEIIMNTDETANAILVGHAGVGKTTVAETIAWKIANGKYKAPSIFADAKFMRVAFGDLLAGTQYRGALEERVMEMVRIAKKDPKIIYFIDETHAIVGAGRVVGSEIDISKLLLGDMGADNIRILGAATCDDYQAYIQPKEAFSRRLFPVYVNPPTDAECFKMLGHSYRVKYENTVIKVSDQAIAAAIFFSKGMLLHFPGKAIGIIKYAVAMVRLKNLGPVTIDAHHIAQAFLRSNQREATDVTLAVDKFKIFISLHTTYFPGLTDGETLWIPQEPERLL